MVAAASEVHATLLASVTDWPTFDVSLEAAKMEVEFYRKQLGLDGENFKKFATIAAEKRKKYQKFCVASETLTGTLVHAFSQYPNQDKSLDLIISAIGLTAAGSASFITTYSILTGCLDEMEKAALEFLEAMKTKIVE